MMLIFRPRIWFLFLTLACAGMMAFAIYKQHVDFVDPCPLCVLQRVAFIWIGAMALVAFIHNPGSRIRWLYGGVIALGGMMGMGIAGRHVWLQSLPADQVPDCGMGLNYMLETMPLGQVLAELFYGSGECAEVSWAFLGLSMPGWTFLWYTAFTVGTITVLILSNKAKS
jgi:disulfide bond formation protein DsbB